MVNDYIVTHTHTYTYTLNVPVEFVKLSARVCTDFASAGTCTSRCERRLCQFAFGRPFQRSIERAGQSHIDN